MKILFITRKYPPQIGGMETFSAGLVQALGTAVTLYAWRGSQIHLVWWYPVTLVRVLCTARRYDVVHFGDGVLALMAALVAWCTPRPVTITLHGLDVTYQSWLYQWLLRWSLPRLAHCVCVSRATATATQQRGVLPERLTVIPNGIIVADWPIKTASTPHSKLQPKQLLSVGRLVPRKGIAWFIAEVLPKLKTPLQYQVVGSGPAMADLQRLVQTGRLESVVTFHGSVSAAVLRSLYLQADAFIMPNTIVPGNPEGFGIVAIEAAACGIPVLAARVDGISDAVVDGETGFLLKSGSVLDWVEAIERVITTNPLPAEHIRATVQAHFSWQTVGQHYSTLFNHLIVTTHVKRDYL